MSFKGIVMLALAVLAVVFVAQNTAVVEVRFLFWHASLSRALLMLFWLIAGLAMGWLGRGFFLARRHRD